jgi:hypothetical protein
MKHLQHTSETYETPEIDTCNMHFQVQHLLAAWIKIEARQLKARRRCGTQCYGVVRRLPLWTVELIGGTNLGRGHGKLMEHGRNGRCKFERAARARVPRARIGPSHEQRRAARRASGRRERGGMGGVYFMKRRRGRGPSVRANTLSRALPLFTRINNIGSQRSFLLFILSFFCVVVA